MKLKTGMLYKKEAKTTIKTAVILLVGLAFFAATVQANGSAIIITDTTCYLLASDGGSFLSTKSKEVSINNKNGIDIVTCKGIQPAKAPRPAKAIHLDYSSTGLSCDTTRGPTKDWMETITPGGQVTLTCKIVPNRIP
jgi:hypothetical protein